jgi:hypothetical protein
MSNIKNIIPLSEWLTFELADNKLIDPPIVKLKLRPITDSDLLDAVADNKIRPSEIMIMRATDAIQEWDLSEDGKPIPCTETKKIELALFLKLLLTSYVKADDNFFATVIIRHAQTLENFLKN